MRLILSCLFFSFWAGFLCAQTPDSSPGQGIDSTEQRIKQPPKPKVPKSFYIPTGLRLGTDLVALGVNVFGNQRQRYEFQADVDFHRIYLVGSYGVNKFEVATDEFNYRNNGNYFRIGLDADFLKFDPDHNSLTFGLRYAVANYAENLTTNLNSPVYGSYTETFFNPNVQARWFEMVTGLRVMIFENVYTGYTFRIQLGRKISDANDFRTYDIPGFGQAQFKNRWTFNYYIAYRISWREKQLMQRTR